MSATADPQPNLKRAITAAAIGNFITWFDYATYGFLAIVIGNLFFPSGNPAVSLLASFAVFGVALLMQPVGAFLFGSLGDKLGRKTILATVVILMSGATATVGLLPTYDSVGILAPILLLVVRCIQGIAGGGEPGGAATFLVESARRDRRARTVSFWHSSSYFANIAASLLILGMHATLSHEQMYSWGWRIPFLIAAPIGIVGLFIRLKLSDTPEFENMKEHGELSDSPIREVLTKYRRQVLQVIGCGAFQYAVYYFVNIYMETYIKSQLNLSDTAASMSTVMALGTACVAIFAFARISDRIGRKPVLYIATVLAVVTTLPVLMMINSGSVPLALIGHILLALPMAMFMAASGAALVEIFPPRVRYSGFSIGFNVAGAVFGGSLAYLATLLIEVTGSPMSPSILLSTAVLALIAVSKMEETVPNSTQTERDDLARTKIRATE